jgi:hypothetical protein
VKVPEPATTETDFIVVSFAATVAVITDEVVTRELLTTKELVAAAKLTFPEVVFAPFSGVVVVPAATVVLLIKNTGEVTVLFRKFRFVPSYQTSPLTGEVGAVPEGRFRPAFVVVGASVFTAPENVQSKLDPNDATVDPPILIASTLDAPAPDLNVPM